MSPTSDLAERLRVAWERRGELHDSTRTAYRLFHGYEEGCPGLSVDRLGDALVLTHLPEHEGRLSEVVDVLAAEFSPRYVVSKLRRGRGEPKLIQGEEIPSELEVREGSLRFLVEPLARRNPGLYLDAFPARRWLLENSQDRRVLNLFAFTGSLGIAAAVGGARGVIHVELQKRQVRRIQRNLALNDLHVDGRDLVREDLYAYLRRALRKEASFDGVVLDPPPQVPNRPPGAGQDYGTLARLAGPLLSPGGWLLCFFHRRDKPRSEYEQEVLEASPAPLEILWRGTSGVDFPEANVESKLRFTAFARRA
ncbi:MAG: class I SAM-dependent methyltransferase [Planctomycetes bacterium]|nr:class I SAM-dependent methyltransferase [Planctomycetota bacterium]